MFYSPAFNKAWMAHRAVNRCGILLQIEDATQEMLQRPGPAVSRYWVIWDVDAGLGMSFLSVRLTTAACLSYSNGPSSINRGWRYKGKFEGFFWPGIILQFSCICKVSNLPLIFRLESQPFLRVNLTTVETAKRKLPHGLWAAETHFPFLSFGEEKTPNISPRISPRIQLLWDPIG